jgi:hypothetical protein
MPGSGMFHYYRICPNQSIKTEIFGRGDVVASTFGDLQVADVFNDRDNGCPDYSQVGRLAAGTAGGIVFIECHVLGMWRAL